MIALMAPLSLVDANEQATSKMLTELNSLVRLAPTLAEDKLQYKTLKKPMFVTFCDAAWANRRRVTNQCGVLCAANEENLMDGHAAPWNPILWHSNTCPFVAPSSSSAETHKDQLRDKLRWSMCGSGTVDLRLQDQQTAATPGTLLIDAKGVFDAVSTSGSAGWSMDDKRSAVESLLLRESLTRSRTRLRWPHSDVNVSDWLPKFDHRAVALIRDLLRHPPRSCVHNLGSRRSLCRTKMS